MKNINNYIIEKLIINKDTEIETSNTSDIFEVIAFTRDINSGRSNGREIIARFAKKADAEKYKEDWEKLYKEHEDNEDSTPPCWLDYDPKLKIVNGKIFNHYNEEILIKQYSDDEVE